MKYNDYPKEKIEKEKIGAGRQFQARSKKQIPHAFSVLSSLHNLHFSWFSI